jgi:hypothetical protein
LRHAGTKAGTAGKNAGDDSCSMRLAGMGSFLT